MTDRRPDPARPVLIAATIAVALATVARPARADVVVTGSFGPLGDVNISPSSPPVSISFGATGQGNIFQLDGFVNVAGQNLSNTPSGFGTSAELGYGAPAGVNYVFSARQPTTHQLLLDYVFTSTSGMALPGFQFLSFVDPDIGSNTFDESVTTSGLLGAGVRGGGPTSFEVGDPNSSTLPTDLANGTLNNINGTPPAIPGDVGTGLGFNIGYLAPGASAEFQVLLADDGTSLGGLTLTQRDPVATTDVLTISGTIVSVPEPTALALMATGLVAVIGRWTLGRTARRVVGPTGDRPTRL